MTLLLPPQKNTKYANLQRIEIPFASFCVAFFSVSIRPNEMEGPGTRAAANAEKDQMTWRFKAHIFDTNLY